MLKNQYSGKFVVIEGLDGSGKSTQSKLLTERLKKEGREVVTIDFPQYGTKSAGLVEEYLNGKYGTAEQVGPYRASVFYACDRYDASSKIKKWLSEGKIVVSDRYIVSPNASSDVLTSPTSPNLVIYPKVPASIE